MALHPHDVTARSGVEGMRRAGRLPPTLPRRRRLWRLLSQLRGSGRVQPLRSRRDLPETSALRREELLDLQVRDDERGQASGTVQELNGHAGSVMGG